MQIAKPESADVIQTDHLVDGLYTLQNGRQELPARLIVCRVIRDGRLVQNEPCATVRPGHPPGRQRADVWHNRYAPLCRDDKLELRDFLCFEKRISLTAQEVLYLVDVLRHRSDGIEL